MGLSPGPIDVPRTGIDPAVETALLAAGGFLVVYLLGRHLVAPAAAGFVRVRNRHNPTLAEAVERYTHLAAFVAAIAVAVAVAGYGHLLAGSAVVIAAVTLAIGVAGQEVIGNLVSGVFLVADPDFNVNDWIAWEDGEGFVESVRFRVTRVRTPNNEVITVPNTTLATAVVTRPYSRERFRIVVRIAVATDEDIDAASTALHEEMTSTDGVLAEPEPDVVVEELDMDATWLRAQFWIKSPSRLDVAHARSAYIRNLKQRLEAEGITFSPPSEYELSGRLEVDRPTSG